MIIKALQLEVYSLEWRIIKHIFGTLMPAILTPYKHMCNRCYWLDTINYIYMWCVFSLKIWQQMIIILYIILYIFLSIFNFRSCITSYSTRHFPVERIPSTSSKLPDGYVITWVSPLQSASDRIIIASFR